MLPYRYFKIGETQSFDISFQTIEMPEVSHYALW